MQALHGEARKVDGLPYTAWRPHALWMSPSAQLASCTQPQKRLWCRMAGPDSSYSALGNTRTLEGGQGGKDGAANPRRVLPLWWQDHLDGLDLSR